MRLHNMHGQQRFTYSRLHSSCLYVFTGWTAVRLSCFQFFGFKRKTPFLAYCKDIKETVDALSFASKEELQKYEPNEPQNCQAQAGWCSESDFIVSE